jgi:hypothetical protein
MAVALVSLVLGGCGDVDPVESASADIDERAIATAELGGSYDFTVEAAPDDMARSLVVLRLELRAGEAVVAVARHRAGDPFDAYLTVRSPEGDSPATQYGQAVLPMAGERDAALLHASDADRSVLVFAGDRELDAATRFQLDLVPVRAAALDLTLTTPAARAYTEGLRRDEPRVVAFLATGALVEGSDGYLVAQPKNAPLAQRAELNGLLASVNDTRRLLFEELARDQGVTPGEAAALCAELWSALRSDAHALR